MRIKQLGPKALPDQEQEGRQTAADRIKEDRRRVCRATVLSRPSTQHPPIHGCCFSTEFLHDLCLSQIFLISSQTGCTPAQCPFLLIPFVNMRSRILENPYMQVLIELMDTSSAPSANPAAKSTGFYACFHYVI